MSAASTVGGVVIAACLSCFSCGIVVGLAGRYFARFSRDKSWIRTAVVVATLWTIMDTTFNATWAYKWGVTYFIQPQKLALLPWELTAYCVVMPTAVLAVQFFYLYRLYAVSNRNRLLVTVLLAFALGAWGIALYMGYVCAKSPNDIKAFSEARSQSWGWFAGVLCVDISITASMFFYLILQPKQHSGGMVHASNPIKQIVLSAAQTNALSAICQICIVILYATYPSALYYAVFGFPETKIYIGSFLATLNARSAHSEGEFDVVNVGPSHGVKSFRGVSMLHHQQPVHVTVRQEVNVDAGDDEDRDDDVVSSLGTTTGKDFPAKAQVAASPYKVQFAHRTVDGGTGDVEKGGKGDSESF
ncbi:hypothetical protein JCM3770_004099 [Rhodotorula araucariae]